MKGKSGKGDKYLNISEAEYGSGDYRKDLKKERFQFIAFNNSSFRNCNLMSLVFKNCDFTRCDFTETRQWDCLYEDCIFLGSKFYNSSMGVEGKYSNCRFVNIKFTGKGFTFGNHTEFKKCIFENCDILSTWILSTIFVECTFASKFINVRFSGEKEANVSSRPGHSEFPATFVNCDFSNSIFENIEIMDGAILTDTLLPNQHSERFNSDRIIYPKE